MLIDAHQHFWRLARGDYGWLTPETGVIYRDFLPDDLAPVLARHGIARTILVQAAPTIAETRFLLDIAAKTPFVAGVVGWIDFDAPDVLAQLEMLASDPLLVGIRPMVQDIADDDWLANPAHERVFEALIRHDLVFDALVLPRHLARLGKVLHRHPVLRVVVDHLAKPLIRSGTLEPWMRDIAEIAEHQNVSCKLSGIVTEAASDWSVEDLAPYVRHAFAVFGPSRILWGSDWPVVNLAKGYDAWMAASAELTAHLSSADQAAVFGLNARRVYLNTRGISDAQGA